MHSAQCGLHACVRTAQMHPWAALIITPTCCWILIQVMKNERLHQRLFRRGLTVVLYQSRENVGLKCGLVPHTQRTHPADAGFTVKIGPWLVRRAAAAIA